MIRRCVCCLTLWAPMSIGPRPGSNWVNSRRRWPTMIRLSVCNRKTSTSTSIEALPRPIWVYPSEALADLKAALGYAREAGASDFITRIEAKIQELEQE